MDYLRKQDAMPVAEPMHMSRLQNLSDGFLTRPSFSICSQKTVGLETRPPGVGGFETGSWDDCGSTGDGMCGRRAILRTAAHPCFINVSMSIVDQG